jgi:hypothetical protein
VVYQQKGIAFAFVFFDHAAGSSRSFKLSDGYDITTGPTRPFTWEIGEMFKVRGMASGWDANWQDAMSSKAR